MNRVAVLCSRDRVAMREFNRRTIDRLRGKVVVALVLPLFKDFIEANVQKEIRKDCSVIRAAAFAFHDGRQWRESDTDDLFERSLEIDAEFIEGMGQTPLALDLRSADFGEIRKARITLLARTVGDLLKGWPEGVPFERRVSETYSAAQFKEIVDEFFRLYRRETLMLSASVRLPMPLRKVRNSLSSQLSDSMEVSARALRQEWESAIFGRSAVK